LPNSFAGNEPVIPLAFLARVAQYRAAFGRVQAQTVNALLQNCDGRDKSELPRQACCEYEQHFAIVYNPVGRRFASGADRLALRRDGTKSQ
jgi:hypothetical protein